MKSLRVRLPAGMASSSTHLSIATDPPRRWTDQSPAQKESEPGDVAITRELEKRFGANTKQPHDMSHQSAGAVEPHDMAHQAAGSEAGYGGGRGGGRTVQRAVATASALSGAAHSAPNEVLEPHTLPPGIGPDMGETTAMQDFCGSESASWAIVGGHLSQCFIHTVLFAAVDAMFIVAAAMRLRDLLALPRPPPRALTRRQALKVGGASLVAVYNLIMFATHLAYDYGAPYQACHVNLETPFYRATSDDNLVNLTFPETCAQEFQSSKTDILQGNL